MFDTMRQRIAARAVELGLSIFEVEKAAGFKRGYLYEFIAKRKDSIRTKSVPLLATALSCTEDFLWGRAESAGAAPTSLPGGAKWPSDIPPPPTTTNA